VQNTFIKLFTVMLVSTLNACTTPQPTVPASGISGQGIWETTLEARDFDGDVITIEAYYDKVLDITWLADANYVKTSGADKDGRINWHEATDWVASQNINGITGWRLPKVNPINGREFEHMDSCDATTDYGTAATTTDGSDGGWRDSKGDPVSEMGHMYYVTLGNLGFFKQDIDDPSGCTEQAGYGLKNTGPFINLQQDYYWTNTENDQPGIVFTFIFQYGGSRIASPRMFELYAWPVHDGDVGKPISQ